MVLEELSPRSALMLGLLALLPVSWYGFGSSLFAGVVSAVNVALIIGMLYIAFEPVPESHGHGSTDTS